MLVIMLRLCHRDHVSEIESDSACVNGYAIAAPSKITSMVAVGVIVRASEGFAVVEESQRERGNQRQHHAVADCGFECMLRKHMVVSIQQR